MVKYLILGDIHGREWWKDIVEREKEVDKYIFLGDYVSTHDYIPGYVQLDVLKEILLFKEENPDKVILLRGNHDLQHLGYNWAQCSSFDKTVYQWMSKTENKNKFLKLTQTIYIDDELKIIFSHAGVSKVWMGMSNIKDIHDINGVNVDPIFRFTPDNFLDNAGHSETQPPTWIRPTSLIKCMVDGYTQVVGHTPMKKIINARQYIDPDKYTNDLWCCDTCLEQYLIIDNGEFIIKNCNF